MVYQGGLPAQYVLDKMEEWEISMNLRGLYHRRKDMWEATRLLMYSIIQVNSTKEVNMQELIRFPWEHEDAPEGDAESLIEEMRAMADKLNQKIK